MTKNPLSSSRPKSPTRNRLEAIRAITGTTIIRTKTDDRIIQTMDIIGIMTGHTLETTTIREAETTTQIILETIRTTTSHTTKTKEEEDLTIRTNTTATVL